MRGSNVAPAGVADAIERREHLRDEAPELVEQADTVSGSACPNGRQLRQRRQVDEVLEREADVVAAVRDSSAIRPVLGPPGPRDVHTGPFEPAGAQLTRLLRIESLAAEDVERAAVVVAEHARDGNSSPVDTALDDLAAFAHAQALVRTGRRDPDASVGVEADAVRERAAAAEIGPHPPLAQRAVARRS